MKSKEISKILEEQKEWKEFEKCLIPILKNCEACKTYGVCIFHENWYDEVKEAFNKFRNKKR